MFYFKKLTFFKPFKLNKMQKKHLLAINLKVLIVLIVILLNFSACKKESVMNSASQTEAKATMKVQGRAATLNSNESLPTAILVFIPCANGGAGENVLLSGNLHALNTFTINGNSVRSSYHIQPQGISGTGMITGDKYQATGGTSGQSKGSFVNGQFEVTGINNFRIIGQSVGNNFLVHSNFHITINANGSITTVVDNFSVECK